MHGAGAVWLAASPHSAGTIASLLAANHAVIAAAGLFPRSSWLGPNLSRLPESPATAGVVALTFDDGPDPEVTPRVLDLLDRAGQKATFFCIGRRAQAHPGIIAAIRAGGHGVENHSHRHPHTFAFRGPQGLAEEIRAAQAAIAASGGGMPRFFRAPAGFRNPWLAEVLDEAGLSLVSWTRRGFDVASRDAHRITARLLRGLAARDILVLHDRVPIALDVLPAVLEALRRHELTSRPLGAVVPAPAGESD
jgi:peptidoglycan/xylan/chitin deacetylase (PgdA/CDA1 family)